MPALNGDNDAATGHRPGTAYGSRFTGSDLDGVVYAEVRHRFGTDIGSRITWPAMNCDNYAATGHRPVTSNGRRLLRRGPAPLRY